MKRSVGVTTIAVLALIGSGLTLAMGILMLVVMILAPTPASTQFPGSPAFMKALFSVLSLTYLGPAIWGILTGIGLLRLKNWARISIIVFSILLICMAAFSGLLTLFVPLPPSPDRPADPSFVSVIRILMGAFWLALMGLGVWWFVFFTRSKVKAQFVPAQLVLGGGDPQPFPPPSPGAIQAAPSSAEPSSPRRPVSITIIAWLLLIGCIFVPLNILIHAPAVLFTKLLTGGAAASCYLVYAVIQFFIGMGLLRLKPIARQAAITLFVFGFLNTATFYFAPGGHARLVALLESQKSMFPWLKLLPNQPQFQFDPSPFLVFGSVLGMVGIAVPIYFLVTRKAAFEKVVSEQWPG